MFLLWEIMILINISVGSSGYAVLIVLVYSLSTSNTAIVFFQKMILFKQYVIQEEEWKKQTPYLTIKIKETHTQRPLISK